MLGGILPGVHDYFSGMLSIKHKGLSITEIVGIYLKRGEAVFAGIHSGPDGDCRGGICRRAGPDTAEHHTRHHHLGFWATVVFIYYALATMLPIDKIIGRVYPVFGFALFFMAIGIMISLFVNGYSIPELSLSNLGSFHVNPDSFPVFPMMFITIACGAVSGFHTTSRR